MLRFPLGRALCRDCAGEDACTTVTGWCLGSVYRLADRWRAVERVERSTALGVLVTMTARKLTPLVAPGLVNSAPNAPNRVGYSRCYRVSPCLTNGILETEIQSDYRSGQRKIADIAEPRTHGGGLEIGYLGLNDNGSLLLDFGPPVHRQL